MRADLLTFTGHIAGLGTQAGIRIVIGCWAESPFGGFSDVMVQTPDDQRILLAPNREVAEFVSSTYQFDAVALGPVCTRLTRDTLSVTGPELTIRAEIGGPAATDRLLRLIPGRLATARWWLRAIDPVAARILPGVHTAGTAGHGRREYYAARRSRLIDTVTGRFGGTDLGGVAALYPPVRFGFASAPKTPQIVTVTTQIDMASRFG